MKRIRLLIMLGGLLALHSTAWAFAPPMDTAGPLTIRIADPGEIRALDKPIAVPVTLTNAGDAPLAGTVRVWGVDGWLAEGEAARGFSLAPKGSQVVPFNVVPDADSYAALYPVHAQAQFGSGPAQTAAHAILILSVARGRRESQTERRRGEAMAGTAARPATAGRGHTLPNPHRRPRPAAHSPAHRLAGERRGHRLLGGTDGSLPRTATTGDQCPPAVSHGLRRRAAGLAHRLAAGEAAGAGIRDADP